VPGRSGDRDGGNKRQVWETWRIVDDTLHVVRCASRPGPRLLGWNLFPFSALLGPGPTLIGHKSSHILLYFL
jgi:hypothetical protein